MTKKPKLGFEVAESQDDIIGCDIVVCARAEDNKPLLMPDNVMDLCSRCGCKVQLRPYVPPGPKRVCHECGLLDLQEQAQQGEEVVIMLSPKTVREVKEYLHRKLKERSKC